MRVSAVGEIDAATVDIVAEYRRTDARATEQPLDEIARFLQERIERGEARVFVARDDGNAALGFVILYCSFSTVALAVRWILNDLFVAPAARGKGVATALIGAAVAAAKEVGVPRMFLRTGIDNVQAQRLYERLGWKRDTRYWRYDFVLSESV